LVGIHVFNVIKITLNAQHSEAFLVAKAKFSDIKYFTFEYVR